MNNLLTKKNITFIITTFRSRNTIFDCLDSLSSECKKIIIENSNDESLMISLSYYHIQLSCIQILSKRLSIVGVCLLLFHFVSALKRILLPSRTWISLLSSFCSPLFALSYRSAKFLTEVETLVGLSPSSFSSSSLDSSSFISCLRAATTFTRSYSAS